MKYGLLKYTDRSNLGDEIQSLAAQQFLPRTDAYYDREQLHKVNSEEPIRLLMNGFFLSNAGNWPPSDCIEPVFISFHIDNVAEKKLLSKASLDYLKQYQPIGCRDTYTRDILRNAGVDAWFSGCLTLTMKNQCKERTDEIVLVDVPKPALESIPKDIQQRAVMISHSKKHHKSKYTNDFDKAQELLDLYRRCKLVITRRLHAALPCVAFGTPVYVVHPNIDDRRFTGVSDWFRLYSVDEFRKAVHHIDFENPEPNPVAVGNLAERLAEKCVNTL